VRGFDIAVDPLDPGYFFLDLPHVYVRVTCS